MFLVPSNYQVWLTLCGSHPSLTAWIFLKNFAAHADAGNKLFDFQQMEQEITYIRFGWFFGEGCEIAISPVKRKKNRWERDILLLGFFRPGNMADKTMVTFVFCDPGWGEVTW